MSDIIKAIGNKAELYESAIRNGFYLPKLKSSIITEDYIYGVLIGNVLCPKYRDIKLLPCPRPPDKETLINLAEEAMSEHSKSLGIDASHTPDKGWLISVISTFNPSCEIFKKSYVPPPRIEKVENKAKVSLPADFLEGLPVSRKKHKVRRLGFLRQGKEEVKNERIKGLHEQYKKQLVLQENHVKTLGHRSKNKQELISKRTFVARQGRSSQGAPSSVAAGG